MRKPSNLTASVAACLSLWAASAHAEVIEIPEQSGFSGYVSASIGTRWLASNTISGTKYDQMTDRRIDSLFESPSGDFTWGLAPNFDVRYTFGSTGTQLYLGNLLQDALRFDFSQAIGVRQRAWDKGIVNVALLFSAAPTKVYNDPYQSKNETGMGMGVRRGDTDRDSLGTRLSWERIWGSGFTVYFDYRDVDIDRERSGFALRDVGDPRFQNGEEDLLDREGDIYKAELRYDWRARPNLFVTPAIRYEDWDKDGDAVSGDYYDFTLTATRVGQRHTFTVTGFGGFQNADEAHPLYDRRSDSKEFGIGAAYFWHNLFKVKDLSLLITASYAQSDNDNRFLDLETYGATFGVFYRFSTFTSYPEWTN